MFPYYAIKIAITNDKTIHGIDMKLLVRNLDRATKEEELRNLFHAFGEVQSCDLVVDKVSGVSKGFGIVVMPISEEAKTAIEALNDTAVGRNTIRVKEADAAKPDVNDVLNSESLKDNPFEKRKVTWTERAVGIYNFFSIPIATVFLLSPKKIHRDYSMSLWTRMKLGYRVYSNTKKIFTGTSYQAHLAMAQKLFTLPKAKQGVVVECGCFRGGTTANLSLFCRIAGRDMIVYDSFEGLPPAVENDLYSNEFSEGFLAAGIDQVKAHVTKYGDASRCTFVKGFFKDTLPSHDKKIVFMFFDVDFQDSLHDCMLNLWPHLDDKGYLFTDEYVYTDYCALFYSEKYWKKYFNRTPPGLLGAGSGIPLGSYYTGMPFDAMNSPGSIAFTRKNFSGYWNFYPDEESKD